MSRGTRTEENFLLFQGSEEKVDMKKGKIKREERLEADKKLIIGAAGQEVVGIATAKEPGGLWEANNAEDFSESGRSNFSANESKNIMSAAENRKKRVREGFDFGLVSSGDGLSQNKDVLT